MPTDILVSVAERRERQKRNAADLIAMLVVVPLIACLFSITLCFESRAFECVTVLMATE